MIFSNMKTYYIRVFNIVNKQPYIVPVLALSEEDALVRVQDYPYHSNWFSLTGE